MSQNDVKPNATYTVKIFGCATKEITIEQQKIMVKDVSTLAELPEDTVYKVDGTIVTPQTEITVYDGIELECGDFEKSVKPNATYTVKIFGCATKEITIEQQKIMVKDVSTLAELPEDTVYKVDGTIVTPQTEITVYDGIELECGDFGGAS